MCCGLDIGDALRAARAMGQAQGVKVEIVRTLMRADRSNHRQSWTLNLTAHEIAIELGRTEEAVQLKARQHGPVISKAHPPVRR